MAIAHADSVIELQASLQSDEQPADWVWEVPWALTAHLARVAEKRSKPKKPGEEEEEDWDDESKWEQHEIPEGWR